MPKLDPLHGSRRSPIDERNDLERDVALRPSRPSGGPFPLRDVHCLMALRGMTHRHFLPCECFGHEHLHEVPDRGYPHVANGLDQDCRTCRLLVEGRETLDEQDEYVAAGILPADLDPEEVGAAVRAALQVNEYSPRHPDPRCAQCEERLGDADRAEVFLTTSWEGSMSEGVGPFVVHADPCFTSRQDKWRLA